MASLALPEFVLRIACAFTLGALIGFERQWRQRMGGLRTNTLLATGSALFVTVANYSPGDNHTQIVINVVLRPIGRFMNLRTGDGTIKAGELGLAEEMSS